MASERARGLSGELALRRRARGRAMGPGRRRARRRGRETGPTRGRREERWGTVGQGECVGGDLAVWGRGPRLQLRGRGSPRRFPAEES